MLYKESFTAIGFIRKGHGYNGQARIEIQDEFEEILEKQQFIFLEIDGYKVPFYIESRSDDKFSLLKLEHIDSPVDLLTHHQKPIYLLTKDIPVPEDIDLEEDTAYLINMEIHDVESGRIGIIKDIEKYPHQMFAIVEIQKKKQLIPLHEDLIIDIDSTSRKITMELPAGLLDI